MFCPQWEAICNFINGKCTVAGVEDVEMAYSSFKTETIIGRDHNKLRDEVMGNQRIKITPLSRLRKVQDFVLIPDNPPAFPCADGMLNARAGCHVLKNHFCLVIIDVTLFITRFASAGEQKVADRAIKRDTEANFYRGDSIGQKNEITVLDAKLTTGLKALVGSSNATEHLDIIMYKDGEDTMARQQN
jgi:hypothetical protein